MDDDQVVLALANVFSAALMLVLSLWPAILGVRAARRKGISPHWMWFALYPILGGWIAYIAIVCSKTVSKCPQCGTRTRSDALFCPNCGAPAAQLGRAAAPVGAPAVPPPPTVSVAGGATDEVGRLPEAAGRPYVESPDWDASTPTAMPQTLAVEYGLGLLAVQPTAVRPPVFSGSGDVTVSAEAVILSGRRPRFGTAMGCLLGFAVQLAVFLFIVVVASDASEDGITLGDAVGILFGLTFPALLLADVLWRRGVIPSQYEFSADEVLSVDDVPARVGSRAHIRFRTARQDGRPGHWEWVVVPEDRNGLIRALNGVPWSRSQAQSQG